MVPRTSVWVLRCSGHGRRCRRTMPPLHTNPARAYALQPGPASGRVVHATGTGHGERI